jgi:hypothetical protein
MAGLNNRGKAATLPFSRTDVRIGQKSPANAGKIPVFESLTPETWFDHHRVAELAVQPSEFLPRRAVIFRTNAETNVRSICNTSRVE